MGKQIEIGRCGKAPVYFDLETLLRTRLLGQANSGGGKSWAARRLAEQLFGHIPVHIIDPEGEFSTLREKFGFVLVGKGGELSADPRYAQTIAHKLLELRASAVYDLYELKPPARHRWVKLFLEALVDAPKHLWRPTVVMLDEAHVFCPEKGQGESEAFGAVQDLVTRGRKRGLCPILWTQRLSKLSKNVSAECLNRLVGMTFEDVDLDRAADLLSVPRADRLGFFKEMKALEPGDFYGLGRAIAKDRVRIRIGPVQTTHPEMGSGAVEPPPPPEKIRALLPKLADLPKEAEEKAKTEADLRTEIRSLKAQLSARPAPPPPARPNPNDVRVVEVPVAGKREVARLEKLVTRIEEAKKAYWGTTTSLENATRDISALVDRLKDGRSTNEVRKSVGLKPIPAPKPIEINPRPTPTFQQTGRYVAGNGSAEALDKCERAVLTVLARHQEGCSIDKIALLSGYRKSGSFKNALSSLRSRALIEGQNTSFMKATQAGLDAVGPVEMPTGEELVAHWMNHPSFGLCEKQILDNLLQNPDGLTMEELCIKTGYSASGSFKNALSSLRTAGVLVGKNNETMRPAEALIL